MEKLELSVKTKLSDDDKKIVFDELDYLTSRNEFNEAILEFIETGYLPSPEKELE